VTKILLAEDDINLAAAICTYLERRQLKVDHVVTGTRALIQASDPAYSVIIMDINLPQMDGLTVCRRLRQDHVDTPIIFLTAKADLPDILAGINIGGDGYMTKPFHLAELEARVQALITRPPTSKTQVVKVGEFHIDLVEETVTKVNGLLINLRKREFSILKVLCTYRGKVLTREAILAKLENDRLIGDGTIDVHISRIRKILGKRVIETIHGKGYRLVPAG
jgi:two-component system, OmpR family, response regulator